MYLYCIVPAAHRPSSGLAGLDGGAVRAVDAGRLAAWVSTSPARPEPSPDSVRQHHAVVAGAASETITPVPVRFGEWFATEGSLLVRLREREQDYLRLLEHVAGAAEFGLRMLAAEPAGEAGAVRAAPAPGTERPAGGRAFMESLARRYAVRDAAAEQAERVGAELRAALSGRIRDERFEVGVTGRGSVNLVHLIEHADADLYREAVRVARRQFEDVRFLLSGPWPPYSFVA